MTRLLKKSSTHHIASVAGAKDSTLKLGAYRLFTNQVDMIEALAAENRIRKADIMRIIIDEWAISVASGK